MELNSDTSLLSDGTWRRVPGFGRYVVSPEGVIKNQATGQVIKWRPIQSRAKHLTYWRVGFYRLREGERERGYLYVHRIVAMAYVPGQTEERCHVHHIDGDPSNNAAGNLMWVAPSENSRYIHDPYEGIPPYEEPEAAPF